MRNPIRAGLLLLMIAFVPGCVSWYTHSDAQMELSAAKLDLKRALAQNQELAKQLAIANEANAKLKATCPPSTSPGPK